MGYARHIGRVGALAVALGVGSAIAGGPGVATAEPTPPPDVTSTAQTGTEQTPATRPDDEPSDDEPSAEGPDGGSDATALPSTPSQPESGTASRVEVAPGVVVSHSGGAQTSSGSTGLDRAERVTGPKKSNKSRPDAAPSSSAASTPESSSRRPSDGGTASVTAFSSPASASPTPSPTTPTTLAVTKDAAVLEPSSAQPVPAPATAVRLVLGALAAVFGANGGGPITPASSPAAWVLAAAARREIGTAEEDGALVRTTAATATLAVAPNAAPVDPVATVGTPNASTGVVTGTVKATDPNGDTLTYTAPASTTKGSISITSAGAFTYTPTAAARHAAAAVNAPAAAKQDTFTVTIKDGYGATVTKAVTVTVLGKNAAPTGYANVGWPDGTTGAISGYVSAGDADYDPLSYSAANTTKGTVTVTSAGGFTYTPTVAARHAAAAVNAPAAAKQDTFTIAVKDGYGGITNVNVTVTIVAKNTAPTNPTATVGTPNASTGVVTGTVGATDADGDAFAFTTPATTTKGAVSITNTGAFTYTPTAAARHAAGAVNATAAAKQDTFTVTISDGYGGTVTKAVTVTVLGKANVAPADPTVTVGTPNASTGVVTGTVKTTDPDGDALTVLDRQYHQGHRHGHRRWGVHLHPDRRRPPRRGRGQRARRGPTGHLHRHHQGRLRRHRHQGCHGHGARQEHRTHRIRQPRLARRHHRRRSPATSPQATPTTTR